MNGELFSPNDAFRRIHSVRNTFLYGWFRVVLVPDEIGKLTNLESFYLVLNSGFDQNQYIPKSIYYIYDDIKVKFWYTYTFCPSFPTFKRCVSGRKMVGWSEKQLDTARFASSNGTSPPRPTVWSVNFLYKESKFHEWKSSVQVMARHDEEGVYRAHSYQCEEMLMERTGKQLAQVWSGSMTVFITMWQVKLVHCPMEGLIEQFL